MHVIGILGSPRLKGNTDILLDAYLAGAREAGAKTEKVVLNKLDYVPCQGCGGCDKTGRCVHKDDVYDLYERFRTASQIIIASPIYFMGITAQTKAMIDRCQANWAEKHLLKKPVADIAGPRWGVFISTGGTSNDFIFSPSRTILKAFFSTLDVIYKQEFVFPGIDHQGEIEHHPEIIESLRLAGMALTREQLTLPTEVV
ncbi:MAG: flavodoxin family protein [Nitrospirota bacterium]|nr:flavodoxin family protein [Nitrospirota bacterium]